MKIYTFRVYMKKKERLECSRGGPKCILGYNRRLNIRIGGEDPW